MQVEEEGKRVRQMEREGGGGGGAERGDRYPCSTTPKYLYC